VIALRAHPRLRLTTLSLILVAAACDSPMEPTEDPPLQLLCSAPVTLQTAGFTPVDVTYTAPQPSGGAPPYNTACGPPSGSAFPVGETTVRCDVSDAMGRTATCLFPVTVAHIATLAKTRFVAFGDSITEGVVSPAPSFLMALALHDGYPDELQARLSSRYPLQQIVVINRGIAGERLSQGVDRLPGVLDADRPEVVLLLEGVNGIRETPPAELFADIATMVDETLDRGIDVIIGRLLPASADYEASHPGILAAIENLNGEIDHIAATRGIGPAVDFYGLFMANPQLLGGLHPTEEGYRLMADTWADAIAARYEQ